MNILYHSFSIGMAARFKRGNDKFTNISDISGRLGSMGLGKIDSTNIQCFVPLDMSSLMSRNTLPILSSMLVIVQSNARLVRKNENQKSVLESHSLLIEQEYEIDQSQLLRSMGNIASIFGLAKNSAKDITSGSEKAQWKIGNIDNYLPSRW